jgi:hypothetical protein
LVRSSRFPNEGSPLVVVVVVSCRGFRTRENTHDVGPTLRRRAPRESVLLCGAGAVADSLVVSVQPPGRRTAVRTTSVPPGFDVGTGPPAGSCDSTLRERYAPRPSARSSSSTVPPSRHLAACLPAAFAFVGHRVAVPAGDDAPCGRATLQVPPTADIAGGPCCAVL